MEFRAPDRLSPIPEKTKSMKRTKTTGVSKKNAALKKRLAKKAGRKGRPKSAPKKKVQKTKKSPDTLAVYLKTPGALLAVGPEICRDYPPTRARTQKVSLSCWRKAIHSRPGWLVE